MPRLSDRAFKVIELEIANLHNQGIIDKLDSLILTARLRSLRVQPGKHLTRIEVWESLCDVIPDIEPKVLISAAASGQNFSDVRISAGVGAAAVLVASALSLDAMTAPVDFPLLGSQVSQSAADSLSESLPKPITKPLSERSAKATELSDNPILKRLPLPARFTDASSALPEPTALSQAKGLGWQAALKGKNPPHSSQHWRETASLWRQALVYLNQVPAGYAGYESVEEKIAFYERNLDEVERRIVAAAARERSARVQNPTPGGQAVAPKFVATEAETDYLVIARRYGWQASLAAQNAPYPTQKWADISRLWKQALHNLEQIPADAPQYEEAQRVKAIYQQNLASVRHHYQKEQAASQTVSSLQAALSEIESSGAMPQVREAKSQAIVAQLEAIPASTNAYLQAQEAIAQMRSTQTRNVEIAASY